MNTPPKKPPAGEEANIPVLTDRLGFPPLEFDTTLPMIDSTLGKFEDADLDVPTVQPLEPLHEATPEGELPPLEFPPMPDLTPPPEPARAAAPRSTPLPTLDTSALAAAESVRVVGGAYTAPAPAAVLGAPVIAAAPPPPAPAPAAAPAAAPARSTGPLIDVAMAARLEAELRNIVLRGLAERLPREVEAAVRAQMMPAVDRLIAGLAAETRLAVAASVREIVEQTVRAEIERLRGASRSGN